MNIDDLKQRIRLIENRPLQDAIMSYVNYHKILIEKVPASINYHHNWSGGLLIHTIEVHDLCINMVGMLKGTSRPNEYKYVDTKKINIDNLRSAAILHDLGKMFLYTQTGDGHWMYRLKNPPDHAILVITDFSDVTKFALVKDISLSILSHEGGWSRTGVSPDTIGSSILASADLLSSRLINFVWNQ
jgi:23S rRNA maturation-related 3'-5' exoribonuclease YhaM